MISVLTQVNPSTTIGTSKGQSMTTERTATAGKPPVVDVQTWRAALADLRRREKAATRELDAIAAARRRLPMVKMDDYTLSGRRPGPARRSVFKGRSQLIVYNHMWNDGAEWQCGGCTSLTSQYTRLDFLDNYSARFVIVTNGPIDEALAYRDKVGNRWSGTPRRRVRSAPTSTQLPTRASRSTCSCVTATRSTAPGTPTVAASSNSATPFR